MQHQQTPLWYDDQMEDLLGIPLTDQIRFAQLPAKLCAFPFGDPVRSTTWHPLIYVTNPWGIIEQSIRKKLIDPKVMDHALASLVQARELYHSLSSLTLPGALAMTSYYMFYNMVRALLYCNRKLETDQRAMHGMAATSGYADRLSSAVSIEIHDDQASGDVNLAAELWRLLGAGEVPRKLPLTEVALQCVFGHRMLCQALGKPERFIRIRDSILFRSPKGCSGGFARVALRVIIAQDDVGPGGQTEAQKAVQSGLPSLSGWTVGPTTPTDDHGRKYWRVDSYSDEVCLSDEGAIRARAVELVNLANRELWQVATTKSPSFRRQFLFDGAAGTRLPQFFASFVTMFYLGSMNRYSPLKFRKLLEGPHGGFVQEFLSAEPNQWVYLMGSALCGVDLARPEVV